jgi:cytochrome c2
VRIARIEALSRASRCRAPRETRRCSRLSLPLRHARRAAAAPFAHGDAKAGKALAERDCVACHEQKFKPASAIYTRTDRRVTSRRSSSRRCRSATPSFAPTTSRDEENVAAFLNDTYYKFKP